LNNPRPEDKSHLIKFNRLLGLFFGLMILCGSVLFGEDYSKLLSDFKNQSIPVEDINVKDDYVIFKLHYHQTEDDAEDSTRNDILEIIRKTAENFKEIQFITIQVFDTEQQIIDLTIESKDAVEYARGNLDEESLVKKVKMKEHVSLEEVLKSVIPNEEEIKRSNEEFLKYSKEQSLRSRDKTLNKQIIEDQKVQDIKLDEPQQDRTSRGGGSPGIVVLATRNTSQLLVLVGFLCLGCLVLIVGIRTLKHRQAEYVLKVKASLEVQYANGGYKIYPIQKANITIGRDTKNDLVLNDNNASAFHAEIIVSSNAFIIKDLESSNGTMVNGAKVSQKSLYLEDEIVIGSTKLLVKS